METKSNLFWTLMPQGFWNMHLSDLGKPMSALRSSQHIISYPWFCLKELSPKHFRFFFCHYLTLAFLLKGLTEETQTSFCGWAKLFEDKAGPAEHMGTVGICHNFGSYLDNILIRGGQITPFGISYSLFNLKMFPQAWYRKCSRTLS